MLKFKKCILLVAVVVFSVFMVGCSSDKSGSSGTKEEKKNTKQKDEKESSDFLKISLGDTKLEIPMYVKTLDELGLTVKLDEVGLNADTTLPPNVIYSKPIRVLKGEEDLGATVVIFNNTTDNCKVSDCIINNMSDASGNLSFNGCKVGTLKEEVVKSMGNPSSETDENGINTLRYIAEGYSVKFELVNGSVTKLEYSNDNYSSSK